MSEDRTRERGTIESVEARLDRDYFHTVWVLVDLDAGGGQGFGGFMLGKDEHGEREKGQEMQAKWIAALCETFGVRTQAELVGQPCFALRHFGRWNEPIVGLDAAKTGKRFLVSRFVREHFPEAKQTHPLEKERANAKATIARLENDIGRQHQRLAGIESEFAAWAHEEYS